MLKPLPSFLDTTHWSTSSKTIALVLLSLLAVSPRLFFIDVPFERDEGVYAYISDVIDRGGIPYRDAFDHKPPLVYYLYNLSFRLFGHHVIAPRLVAIFFTAIACLFAFLIVYRITRNKVAGFFTMAFLGLSSTSPAYSGFETNTEIFTLPFLTAGSYYLLIANQRLRYFLLAGLLFGCAFATKQVAITIAYSALFTCAFCTIKPKQILLKSFILFSGGFFIPFGLFSLYFIWHDSFGYFWDYFFTYNVDYATTLSATNSFQLLITRIATISTTDIATLVVFIIGLIAFIKLSKSFFDRAFILSLLIGSLVATAMGRYFYGHYFIVMLPFIAISIGLGVGVATIHIKTWLINSVLLIAFIISLVLYMPYFNMSNANLILRMYGDGNPFYQSVSVGDFLKKVAPANSTAFILGSEGQILFYSGLKSASSIFYFYPLTRHSAIQQTVRSKALYDLKNNLPTYVIQVNSVKSNFLTDYTEPFIIELFSILNDYHPIAVSLFNADSVSTNPDVIEAVSRTTPEGSIIIYERTKPTNDQRIN